MSDGLLNVVLGLVASAISAGLGWLAQTVRRRRKLERLRTFFGIPRGTECLLVVNKHAGSTNDRSVARNDVYALMELAALVKECDAKAEMVPHDQVHQGLGNKAEFCIGGPISNRRSEAHLAWRLPGVRFEEGTGTDPTAFTIGSRRFAYARSSSTHGGEAYAVLARLSAGSGTRPVFLICGQTAVANHASVRYLTSHHRDFARQFGADATFAVVLRVVNPGAYGPDVVELVGDVTEEATTRPDPPSGTESATGPAAEAGTGGTSGTSTGTGSSTGTGRTAARPGRTTGTTGTTGAGSATTATA